MNYDKFIAAYKRAENGNGPWFSTDQLWTIIYYLKNFCHEEYVKMMEACNNEEDVFIENLRRELILRGRQKRPAQSKR